MRQLSKSLHLTVHVRYSTIQNWSDNVYNLVTKRARALSNATVEWIDGNLGAAITMKYPAVYLNGPGARGTMLSIAFANRSQIQDTGAKKSTMPQIHQARLCLSPLLKVVVRSTTVVK
jgi:Fe-S cluster assembly scaffold protein SufB